VEKTPIIDRLFGSGSFLRSLPIIVVPSIIYAIISIIFFYGIVPSSITELDFPVAANYFLVPLAALMILVVLWIVYKNSLYFRIAGYILLNVSVTAFMAFLLADIGIKIGNILIIYLITVIFIILLILFTVYTIKKPLELITGEINRTATGELSVADIGLKNYGTEFAEVEDAYMEMIRKFQGIVMNIQGAANRLNENSSGMASGAEELNASSEEISSVVQQMNRGAQQQAEKINDVVMDVRELSEIATKIIQDISSTIGLISDVSAQTNMLALNAAIVAACSSDAAEAEKINDVVMDVREFLHY